MAHSRVKSKGENFETVDGWLYQNKTISIQCPSIPPYYIASWCSLIYLKSVASSWSAYWMSAITPKHFEGVILLSTKLWQIFLIVLYTTLYHYATLVIILRIQVLLSLGCKVNCIHSLFVLYFDGMGNTMLNYFKLWYCLSSFVKFIILLNEIERSA